MRLHWLAVCAITTAPVFAAPTCFVQKIGENGFEKKCQELQNRKPGGEAYATFADAFNINPSALPLDPTSWGLELLSSWQPTSVAGSKYNLSVIKGFKNIGVGSSTNSDNTFYSGSFPYEEDGYQAVVPESSLLPTVNFGTALGMPQIGPISRFLRPSLGVALRKSAKRSTQGYAFGLSLSPGRVVNLGLSYLRDPASGSHPSENTSIFNVGLSLGRLFLDLSHFETQHVFSTSYGGTYSAVSIKTSYTILSTTLIWGRLAMSAALRANEQTVTAVKKTQVLSALQVQLTSRMRAGYLYGYVPGAHTLGAQIMLF